MHARVAPVHISVSADAGFAVPPVRLACSRDLMRAPDPEDFHDVHSIYFQALGEHGFVGLALFLLLWAFTWRTASKIARIAKRTPNLKRLADLTLMVQTSLIGYAVGGAFLGLAYFDLPYHLMTMVVISKVILEKAKTANPVLPATAHTGRRETMANGVGMSNYRLPHEKC